MADWAETATGRRPRRPAAQASGGLRSAAAGRQTSEQPPPAPAPTGGRAGWAWGTRRASIAAGGLVRRGRAPVGQCASSSPSTTSWWPPSHPTNSYSFRRTPPRARALPPRNPPNPPKPPPTVASPPSPLPPPPPAAAAAAAATKGPDTDCAMDDSKGSDSDPPAGSESGGGSSAPGGGNPALGPSTRPPSPPETPREARLAIAALASGELQRTPGVLETLGLYEGEAPRRDREGLAWMQAPDEAVDRAEAAERGGPREGTMPCEWAYDREAFQDYTRISRQRARREGSSGAAAAGGGGLRDRTVPYEQEAFQGSAGTMRLQGQQESISRDADGRYGLDDTGLVYHEVTNKSVDQANVLNKNKPILGLGTELPDQSRFRLKQLPLMHTSGHLVPEKAEKTIHYEDGLHQEFGKLNQLQQALQDVSTGITAGRVSQDEKMMLYEEENLQDFTEFTQLQDSTAGGGSLDGEVMDKLVRRAMKRMQGISEILAPQLLSVDLVYEPLMEFIGRYATWLVINKDKISKEEYDQYEKQLDLMVNLTVVYEHEPQNFSKIVNSMLKIQDCGMPPSDVVADIFPGLDLSTMGQCCFLGFPKYQAAAYCDGQSSRLYHSFGSIQTEWNSFD
ncbi:hypothetical protein ACP4OV_004635 [Aristida adscensionis]